METITLTIPACAAGYRHTAAMLTEMAGEDTREEAKQLADWVNATKAPEPAPTAEGPEDQCEVTSLASTPNPTTLIKDEYPPMQRAETDKTGRPWDERIDSSNHKKTADGVWQKRRNVPQETYDAVVAELMGNAAPAPQVEAPAPAAEAPAPAAPVAPPPPAPAAPTPPPPAPAQTGAPATFNELVTRISKDGLAWNDVVTACQKHGVNDFAGLAARLDLVPTISAELFPNG